MPVDMNLGDPMTSPSGWPDPANPGVPLNAETAGWHLLQENGDEEFVEFWSAKKQAWGCFSSNSYMGRFNNYIGPLVLAITPDPRDTELATLRAEVARLTGIVQSTTKCLGKIAGEADTLVSARAIKACATIGDLADAALALVRAALNPPAEDGK